MEREIQPLTIKPDVILTGEPPGGNDESLDESDDSKYQVCWTNKMAEGKYGKPSIYKRVHALLLYWDKSCGDLSTEGEVNDLKNVLEQLFHYDTTIVPLTVATGGKRTQAKLNAKVATFIDECDGSDTLLILYYAGHGRRGAVYGQLQLLGETSPADATMDREYQERFVRWNETEQLLRHARADIFEIFDCCYAGTLGLTRGEPRLFEYLAATSDMDTTEIPGDRSFTSALIFALKELVHQKQEGRFTTVELRDKIKDKAPRFPKDQCPVLSDRERNISAGRIMLHPLNKAGLDCPPSPRPPSSPGLGGKTVTFLMDFSYKPSIEDITKLGEEMNKMFEYHNFGISRIRWGGMRPDASARSMMKFQAMLGRNRRLSDARLQPIMDNDGSPAYRSSRDESMALTPVDTGSLSPQMFDFLATGDPHVEEGHFAALSISASSNAKDKETAPCESSISPSIEVFPSL